MAAIDFPSSPTNGQIFVANGVSYIYNSTKGYWVASNYDAAPRGYTGSRGLQGYTGSRGGSVTTYTSATAPSSPAVGDFWFNSENGNLLVNYNDGDSSQWVGVSGPRGALGYTGSKGYTGSQGIMGYTGSGATTSAVLGAMAGATSDAVGTYAWLGNPTGGTSFVQGSTYAGSSLMHCGTMADNTFSNNTLTYFSGYASGTWMALSTIGPSSPRVPSTLFLRIA